MWCDYRRPSHAMWFAVYIFLMSFHFSLLFYSFTIFNVKTFAVGKDTVKLSKVRTRLTFGFSKLSQGTVYESINFTMSNV